MANITQTIHSLTGGISQQPDEQKIPGQVKNLVNAIPDITFGLLKRPAGKFVGSLNDHTDSSDNATSDGKYFHYYRDESEQYIGQIARDGTVRMWDCLTGDPKNVVNAIGNNTYLTHTNDEDIQTLTLNDFTYLSNRSILTEMDTTTEPDTNFKKEMFIDLKTVSYARQYALNIFDNTTTTDVSTATRISVDLVKSSNNYCQNDTNNSLGTRAQRITATNRCGTAAGDGRDAYAPNVGTRIFDIDDGASLTDEALSGNHTYTIDVKAGGVDGTGTTSVNRGKNLYFRIRTTGQSVPFTTGEGTTQSTTYQARYTTTFDLLYGGEEWQQGDYFYVWMDDGYYKITIEATSTSTVQANLALIRPNPTSFDTKTTVTAESILGDLRTELIATPNFSASDVEIIGTGLYIKRSSIFNGSTPVGQLLKVIAGTVNDVGDLPTQCKHGMVVEVINSAAEEDNYFVKFFGNNDKDGKGVWEECAKPGRKIRFKYSKMPIALIRTADGNFRLTELNGSTYTISGVTYEVSQWDDAIVGDEDTNPEPSFIGKAINKMLFFRNRMAILADENIVLSRPGNFFNFFGKSAIQLTAADPIDVAASSEYPAILYDGIQVNTGLVLFTENQQFMLTTDSDQFSPLTAKINNLASYNFNKSTNPISLGTTVGFLDNAGKYSRFFEMNRIQREGEVQVIEQSKVVSKLFEKDLKLISNSRENSVLFFSEEDTNTLYGYRYFNQITDRQLASWFKWTVTGTIKYHCMLDDALYVVVRNNYKDQLLKYSVKLDSNSIVLEDNRIHLDHLMSISGFTYNSVTNKSTKAKPVGLESSNQLVAYDVDTGVSLGRYSPVTVNGSNLEISGNWSGQLNTITVTNQGSGYTSAPTVAFSGGGGTNAGGTATVVDGKVTHIEISNTGMNFTSAPTIVIGPVWQAHNASDPLLYSTYAVGDQVTNDNGKLYTCIQAGTAATSGGPTGTGVDITDGTVKWKYAGTQATATAIVNNTFVIGYLYTMQIDFPKIYYVTKEGERYISDARGNTIIHRVKFGFGAVGIYEATLTRQGKSDYTELFEVTPANSYQANSSGIFDDDVLRTIPIYDRNLHVNLTLKSTHPTPATLQNMAWEGIYNNNFYERV